MNLLAIFFEAVKTAARKADRIINFLQAKCEELMDSNEEIQDQNAELRGQVETLRTQNDELRTQVEEFKKMVEDLKANDAAQDEEIQKALDELAAIQLPEIVDLPEVAELPELTDEDIAENPEAPDENDSENPSQIVGGLLEAIAGSSETSFEAIDAPELGTSEEIPEERIDAAIESVIEALGLEDPSAPTETEDI